jgi:SAM-dependent methyltransferase
VDLDEFYAIGKERVTEVLERIPDVGRGRALDWGSGTGRLSFALAEAFSEVTCVDISEPMLRTLEDRARARNIKNIRPFRLEDFEPRADHDLAISLITLQHFPSREAVAEALRKMAASLRTGGYLFVDLPSRPHNLQARVQPRLQLYRLLRKLGISPRRLHARGLSGISMLCVPADWIVESLKAAGLAVREVTEKRHSTHQQVNYLAQKL